MAFNTITGIPVGADLSALGGIHDIPLIVLITIIAPIAELSTFMIS